VAVTAAPRTDLLATDGARIHHEVRGRGPLVVFVGSPMGAAFFAPAAELLADDHTVLTLDPRGVGRSERDDPDRDSTPEQRADDLAALIAHVGAGPAVVVGSSGGAVSALALAQRHPERVRAVVAHEPPVEELLDDRVARRTASEDIVATYLAEGPGAAWEKFFAAAFIGADEDPAGESATGARDVAAPVDDRDPQEIADERFFFVHEMLPTVRFVPDVGVLRAGAPTVVVAIGEDSTGQVCDLTSRALAARLGVEPAMFPGGHVGFVEDPPAFVARLREVLDRLPARAHR
jgi:pimeloyl-ACP methyl ester carboxylesterase